MRQGSFHPANIEERGQVAALAKHITHTRYSLTTNTPGWVMNRRPLGAVKATLNLPPGCAPSAASSWRYRNCLEEAFANQSLPTPHPAQHTMQRGSDSTSPQPPGCAFPKASTLQAANSPRTRERPDTPASLSTLLPGEEWAWTWV